MDITLISAEYGADISDSKSNVHLVVDIEGTAYPFNWSAISGMDQSQLESHVQSRLEKIALWVLKNLWDEVVPAQTIEEYEAWVAAGSLIEISRKVTGYDVTEVPIYDQDMNEIGTREIRNPIWQIETAPATPHPYPIKHPSSHDDIKQFKINRQLKKDARAALISAADNTARFTAVKEYMDADIVQENLIAKYVR